jgi:hypothetical protein
MTYQRMSPEMQRVHASGAPLPQEAEDLLRGLLGDGKKTDAEKLQVFLSRAGDPQGDRAARDPGPACG